MSDIRSQIVVTTSPSSAQAVATPEPVKSDVVQPVLEAVSNDVVNEPNIVETPAQSTSDEVANPTESNEEVSIDPELDPSSKEDRKKFGDKVEKKINKLTKERHQALERAKQAEQRLKEAEGRLAGLSEKSADELDNMSFEERLEHTTNIKVEKALVERDKAAAKSEIDSANNDAWYSQLDEAQSRLSDYDAVVRESKVPINQATVDLIKESPIGADLLYHLAKNPGLGHEIDRSSPLRAAGLLLQLEQRVLSQVNSPGSNITNAAVAPVVTSVTKPAPVVKPKSIATMDMKDFMAMKQKQFNTRRR